MRNTALVGCGDAAIVHWEAVTALGYELSIRLVSVIDSNPDATQACSTQTGARAYGNLTELLATEMIDIVHITAPHDPHIDLALEALSSGINVILEKPLAHEVAEAQRLVDYLDTHPSAPKIDVCFQNRYNISSQELRRHIDSGELGGINGVYSSVVWTQALGYYTLKPWRKQKSRFRCGLLVNQAIHTLDQVQSFPLARHGGYRSGFHGYRHRCGGRGRHRLRVFEPSIRCTYQFLSPVTSASIGVFVTAGRSAHERDG